MYATKSGHTSNNNEKSRKIKYIGGESSNISESDQKHKLR